MGDLVLRHGHVAFDLLQLVDHPRLRFRDVLQGDVLELDTGLRVVGIGLGCGLLPVGEQEVDPNEIFVDLVRVEPTVQGALLGVFLVLATVQPGVSRGGFGVVDDAIGHHVELTTDHPFQPGSPYLSQGTLLDVHQNRLLDGSHFFSCRVDQHTCNHVIWGAELLQVLLVVDDPCLFHGVVDGVTHGTAQAVNHVNRFTLIDWHTARQYDLTDRTHQRGDRDVVLLVLVVIVVIDGPDSQCQRDTGLVGNHGISSVVGASWLAPWFKLYGSRRFPNLVRRHSVPIPSSLPCVPAVPVYHLRR
ncbi:hypothetical protein D3C87_1372530 [compost metagenome]